MNDSKKPYTTGEIASFCHVTINAVKKWIASGKLVAFRTPGGHFRVNRGDFMDFLEKFKLEVKEEMFPERKKILIIDDEKEVVEFIKGALVAMGDGFSIETAGDGYEALIKVGDFKPELLVLDIRMPKIDGFEVCRRIKQDANTSRIKILAVTAYGKEDMERIIQCGADNCLSKPLKLKDFQKNVQRLLK
ncbi:MAG: response regulator [Deltaproteobacteria bacterium]|nr:response regulator [Deltaproteobacteria bacterium]MBZ0219106.1 response regulator [Deltaproteobacteria bacterium]